MSAASKIILGIDPGTAVMGYAIVIADGNMIQLLHMDVLRLFAKQDL